MASWLGEPTIEMFNDVHINFLPLNHAYVVLNTTLKSIGVYKVSENCFKCPYKLLSDKYNAFSSEKATVYEVYAGERCKWRILNNGHEDYIQEDFRRGLLCELESTLGEYGVYRLDVGKCVMETEVPPVKIYLPLLLFSLIMLSAITAFGLIKLFQRRIEASYNDGLDLTATRDNRDIMPSLHFLRGVLLLLIIFVTTGGGGYPTFKTSYGGLTLVNCLLFAYTLSIGIKVPIMFDEDSRRAMSKCAMFCTIFLRSFALLIVGLAISNTAPRSRFLAAPLWAPLPCIAITYFVVAVSYMICTRKREIKPKNAITTAGTLFWSWVLGALLIIIMIVSIHVFDSTQCEQYTEFDPHKTSWTFRGNNCQEDDVFSEVFNKNLLQVNKDEPFYVNSYYAFTKGLLGVLSAILTGLIGLKAGVVYLQHDSHVIRMKQWCLWATVSGIAGVILAAISGPLNFNLWPISTILLISSATLFIYTFFYYLIETKQFSSNIIIICGIASIPTLSGHLLFSQSFPFYWGYHLNTHFIYLWQSTWIVFLWVVIAVCWMRWRSYFISKMVTDEGTRRAVLAW